MKRIFAASLILVVLLAAWAFVFCLFARNECTLYPGNTFQVYALTDAEVGGFSNSELTLGDSEIVARVNIRSGVAYAYAGIGLNLLSVNNRPAGDFFDFSKYDSLALEVETDRMPKVSIRMMNSDPVYSKAGAYLSYRPLVASVAVGKGLPGIALSDFNVPEWWLAGQGLDKDDGLRYTQRGVLLEIFNGEGTLRGIPDQITLRSIRLWGENRTFKAIMYVVLAISALVYVGVVSLAVRNSKDRIQTREKKLDGLKSRMEKAAKLLMESDRSLAEVAIEVGCKNAAELEKNFIRRFGVKPLDYRKNKK